MTGLADLGHSQGMPRKRKDARTPLTPMQERFILEYAKDLNATQAALRAGYKGKYVNRSASQLLERTQHILVERKTMVLAKRERTGIASLEQSLKLATAMAFYDPGKMYDAHGNPIEVPEMSAAHRRAIAGYEVEELFDGKGESRKKIGYVRKYKLADRAPYVHMLLKFHGAFPSKVAVVPTANGAGPRFDTTNWNDEDWAMFRKLREKSNPRVVNA